MNAFARPRFAGTLFMLTSVAFSTTDCLADAQTRPNPPLLFESEHSEQGILDVIQFGAVGDGQVDDSAALQKALTKCSVDGLTCKITPGRTFLIKSPLFIWGKANLVGDGSTGVLNFDVQQAPYLLNVGLSGVRKLEAPFTGSISKVVFRVSGGEGGRVIFFWRTQGARVVDNVFDVGPYSYSATSSGNNNAWVKSGFANCIRKDIVISGNRISATATDRGSEGIGLEHFDGAVIENNEVTGVGDDPIGIHFSTNIIVRNNKLKSTHGRLFVSNSRFVEISNNSHERTASLATGKFYYGIALIYVGFESYERTDFMAPSDINVHDNILRYPPGAIDEGAALYLYGPRNLVVERNRVINDSDASRVSALHLLPATFSDGWSDPDKQDPADIARVWNVKIEDNSSEGRKPLPFRMTGQCKDYRGPVEVRRNAGPQFVYYCPTVTASENTLTRPEGSSEGSGT